MALDPRIGMLNSGKYYCYPNGHHSEEFIGTLDEVEIALGIRQPASKEPTSLDAKEPAAQSPRKPKDRLRDFDVTVTPKITTYAGSQTFSEYTVSVVAEHHNEAIKLVRRERMENEGRYGVAATYRAKLKSSQSDSCDCDE